MQFINSPFKHVGFLILIIAFASCGEVTQEITLSKEGDTTYAFSSDWGPLSKGADEYKASEGVEMSKSDIDIFTILANPDNIPADLDTTMYLKDAEIIKSFDFTLEEMDLLNKVSAHIDYDKPNYKMESKIMMSYSDLEERDAILEVLLKLNELKKSRDSGGQNPKNDASEALSALVNYKMDNQRGVLQVLESVPPSSMLNGPANPNGEAMDESTYQMIKAMLPGGVTTRINLPSKVLKVEGIEYKQIDDSSISVFHAYADILKDRALKAYDVYFEPTEPISDPTFTEVWEPQPVKVTPGNKNHQPPSDAIVLFDGKDVSAWEHLDGSPFQWKIEQGVMTVKPGTGNIITKEKFGDIQLHLEWRSPEEKDKEGQDKGNSGVFLQEKYEVQILNSFDSKTYSNGQAGAIYKQHPPAVNAMRPTGKWQAYDIIFHAPKFDESGNKTESGTLTVLHNGVLIQDHKIIQGTTEYIGYPKTIVHGDGSIILQDHSNEVSFRNIWFRKL